MLVFQFTMFQLVASSIAPLLKIYTTTDPQSLIHSDKGVAPKLKQAITSMHKSD